MRVECHPHEKERDQFTLYVNGEPWRDVHLNICGPHPKLDLNISQDLEQQFLEWEYSQVKRYVLKRLTIKSYPSFELRKQLLDNLVTETNADRILQECQSLGYINDSDWVDVFVRQQQARHLGPQAIAMKLRAKGIPQEMIAEALEEAEGISSQQEEISHLLQTRFKTRDLSQYKEKQKVIAALARKGYNFDQILKALDRA